MLPISVLMSIYKEPIEWIDQSIKSIQSQIYCDYEFLIINDNPDRKDIYELLSEYEKKDSRIRIINNNTNIGLSASMNKLIKISKGKYIARMDADDISLPSRLKKQYEFMENNLDIGVCGCFTRIINKQGVLQNKLFLYSTDLDIKFANLFYTPFVHPTVLIRKSILSENPYNESYRIGLDTDLWLKISSCTKFYNIPECLFYYRIHGDNSDDYENDIIKNSIRLNNAKLASSLFISDKSMQDIYIKYRLNSNLISISDINTLSLYLYDENIFKYPGCFEIIIRKYISYIIRNKMYYRLIFNPLLCRFKIKYISAIFSLFDFYYKSVIKTL